MFNKDHFVQDCIDAAAKDHDAIRDIVAAAVADSAGVISALGEPVHAGVTPLYRSGSLTIINFVWAPYMILMPHNHQMPAVIGIYSGREDNIFWRRTGSSIDAKGAKTLGVGDVTSLEHDVIHSVLNPIGKMSCAIHVYGGDFFAPEKPRSQWNHETLMEQPWNIDQVKSLFQAAEARFNTTK